MRVHAENTARNTTQHAQQGTNPMQYFETPGDVYVPGTVQDVLKNLTQLGFSVAK